MNVHGGVRGAWVALPADCSVEGLCLREKTKSAGTDTVARSANRGLRIAHQSRNGATQKPTQGGYVKQHSRLATTPAACGGGGCMKLMCLYIFPHEDIYCCFVLLTEWKVAKFRFVKEQSAVVNALSICMPHPPGFCLVIAAARGSSEPWRGRVCFHLLGDGATKL